MQASDLRLTSKEMRTFIISQAELRLEGQLQFAAAADQRSAMVSGAATALATVSFACAAQLLTAPRNGPLIWTAIALGAGFSVAAWFSIQSATCQDFHPGGYYPKNFINDAKSRKPMSLVQAEIAEDLNDRLEFNSSVLTQRGRQIALSLRLMFSTPIIGALTFVILAYGQYGAATLQNLLHHLYPTYPEQKITKGDDGQHTLLTLIAEISSRNAIG